MTEENFAVRSTKFLELAATATELQISFVQIREKQLSADKVFSLARQTAEITRDSQTKLLVNDRADIALAANADGVHLPSNAVPAATIRQNFPPNFIIGVSAHNLFEVETAHRAGADFATFSPVFHAPSKAKYNLPPQGIEKLREVCAAVKEFPVLALGGIDETNFSAVLQAGASGFAAVRFLNKNLFESIKKLRND